METVAGHAGDIGSFEVVVGMGSEIGLANVGRVRVVRREMENRADVSLEEQAWVSLLDVVPLPTNPSEWDQEPRYAG